MGAPLRLTGAAEEVSMGAALRIVASGHRRPSRLRMPRRGLTLGVEVGILAAWVALLAMLSAEALAHGGASTRGLWWCAAGMSSMAPSPGVLGPGGFDSVAASAAAGLPMWTMMLATSERLLWTVALTCIVSMEKLARTPRQATNYAAVFLGCTALGVAILAVAG